MPRKTLLNWSTNNAKLRKTRTASFGIPAWRSADGFTTCPMASGCIEMCYANLHNGRYAMPDARRTREENLAIVRSDLSIFEQSAIADLSRMRQTSIRIHDSGDFFSQEYLDNWIRIARTFPDKQFYAYTKSLHLDYSAAPDNLQIVQSVGGRLDARIDRTQSHSRIFATHADRRRAGYVDGTVNDRHAQRGTQKIGLVYHGAKNLKPGQIAWLKAIA